MTVGYCSNVHAATTLEEIRDQLSTHAVDVRRRLNSNAPLPLGLWLPASSLQSVHAEGVSEFRKWLEEQGLQIYTINGFPYGNFHDKVVKHDVYRPNWTDPHRSEYTLSLAELLAELLVDRDTGSISTLPLGWGADLDDEATSSCADNLRTLAANLEDLEERTGRCIHVDLEPEPGCALQRLDGLATFFERHLLGRSDEDRVRRYLRVCVDLCHVAVMFEDLNDGLQALQERGIAVGKVQISNALNVDFNSTDKLDEIGKALEAFREPRWLHQTVIQDGGKQRFYEDLELALAHEKSPHGQWRIHFHVPVHIQSIGPLGTTHAQMLQSIRRLQVHPGPIDWEVETYAWSALPQQLQPDTLSEGIAAELQWVQGLIADETVP